MKERASRNRTLSCDEREIEDFRRHLLLLTSPVDLDRVTNAVIRQDWQSAVEFLPRDFVDLLVLDPPYNLTKNFNGHVFKAQESCEYAERFEHMILQLKPLLKRSASVYVCSDWRTSMIVAPILDRQFHVRNRITWERDKGRGAKSNWKNNTEDIWFATVGDDYTFNVEAVKLRRRVIAPYRNTDGSPKDWEESEEGNFRLTHPSNIWSDLTVPFWSMPENTDHPTQKPEKLIAKLILASSNEQDFVLDPFLGSGTTAAVAKKLNRRFCGIEINEEYSCWALKRLRQADVDRSIQGYVDGTFWERNSFVDQKRASGASLETLELFR